MQGIIKEILEAPIPKDLGTYDRRTLKKVKDLYKECLDETKLDTVGMAPLLDVIRVVRNLYNGSTSIDPRSYSQGQNPLSGSSSSGLTAAIAYMHSRGESPWYSLELVLICSRNWSAFQLRN